MCWFAFAYPSFRSRPLYHNIKDLSRICLLNFYQFPEPFPAYAIALSALQSRIDERPRFGIIGGESSNEAEKVAHQIYKANNTYIYFAGLRRGSR